MLGLTHHIRPDGASEDAAAGDLAGSTEGLSISWKDSATGCTIRLAEPCVEPEQWTNYLNGALQSYRKHGVETALDPESIADPASTALFLAVIDDDGEIVAGVRAQGPYTSADESHAIVEWDGQPSLPTVRRTIADRIPFGVVEIKTAWTSGKGTRGLTAILARMPLHATLLLGAKFAMATAAAHVLDQWRSSGGVVATKIPATPYPDERYHTKMMWWDRSEFSRTADAQQVSTILAESKHLASFPVEIYA